MAEVDADGLAALGLSGAEQRAYEVLVGHSEATVAELSGAPGLGPAPRLARTLRKLVADGLVARTSSRPARYRAVPPESALQSLLLRREDQLGRARSTVTVLAERFRQAQVARPPTDLIELISGESAVAERYAMAHRTARERLLVMARPPFLVAGDANRAITADVHRFAARVRCLVDPVTVEEMGLAALEADMAAGEEYRVLAEVPLKMVVSDERSAVLMLETPPAGVQSALLLHPCALLRSLVEVFDALWRIAAPLDVLQVAGTSIGDDADRELLALLVAGLSDQAIARRLSISTSTVRRRIRELKQRFGSVSRFQAGWQARGLLESEPARVGRSTRG